MNTYSRFLKSLVLATALVTLGAGCGIQSIPTAENEVEASWSEVTNQYKRRADLVPNLVEVVKKYAAHERETLTAVTQARASATQTTVNVSGGKAAQSAEDLKKFDQAQAGLGAALSRLMVVSEKYPDLKANENFRDLSVQLEGTENRITVARQRYIQSVKGFNNLVTVPPSSWTNSLFLHREKKPQFTVENAKQIEDAPKVNL
jgi:LemA protein